MSELKATMHYGMHRAAYRLLLDALTKGDSEKPEIGQRFLSSIVSGEVALVLEVSSDGEAAETEDGLTFVGRWAPHSRVPRQYTEGQVVLRAGCIVQLEYPGGEIHEHVLTELIPAQNDTEDLSTGSTD